MIAATDVRILASPPSKSAALLNFRLGIFVDRLFGAQASHTGLRHGGLQGSDSVATRHPPLKLLPDPPPLKIEFPSSWMRFGCRLVITVTALSGWGVSIAGTIAFYDVTVVDVAKGRVSPSQMVVLDEGRIRAVSHIDQTKLPAGVLVVNCNGKFLIPGLWDMHTHVNWSPLLPLYVANGVTGIRQMRGSARHRQWRDEVAQGKMIGPRQIVASAFIDGVPPQYPTGAVAVADEESARQAVVDEIAAGSDFLKVYVTLSRDAFFAIAKEAKRNGVAFVGHVPIMVTAIEASDAGLGSMEHLYGIPISCSLDEDALRQQVGRVGPAIAPNVPLSSQRFPAASAEFTRRLYSTFDGVKAAALFARFVKNQTWQCPTLVALRGVAIAAGATEHADPRLKYSVSSYAPPPRAVEDLALGEWVFHQQMTIAAAMYRAHVPILVGTDSGGAPRCFHGFSLHDELELLVETGFSPAEALRAATVNAARFLGREADFGAVEPGRFADLVLLDGNPLDDIRNTRRIAAVVIGGKMYPRIELEKMLATVEAAVAATASRIGATKSKSAN